MSDDIYQHYRPEEQPFIDKVFGWIDQVDLTYAPYTTVFLTPREKMIVEQLVASRDEMAPGNHDSSAYTTKTSVYA